MAISVFDLFKIGILPYPFATAAELLAHTNDTGLSIPALMMANEQAFGRDETQIRDGLALCGDGRDTILV